MLSFTDQAAQSLRAVMDMAPPPVAGVRISPAVPIDEWDASSPVLQLAAVSVVDMGDELFIAGDGIAVLVEPAIAPFLEGTVLDSAPGQWATPTFLLEYDLPIGEPFGDSAGRRGGRRTVERWFRR